MVGVLFHLIDVDDEDVGLFPIADHLLLILMLWDDLVHNFALDELLIVDQTSDRLSDRLPHDVQRWKRLGSLAEAGAAYSTATWATSSTVASDSTSSSIRRM